MDGDWCFGGAVPWLGLGVSHTEDKNEGEVGAWSLEPSGARFMQ
jgi:hypothetical protein